MAIATVATAPVFGTTDYSVTAFGAVGDGRTLDSPAINRAISACAVAGGGVVQVPAGTYRCGTIRLKTGVTLALGAGALIAGDSALDGYSPAVEQQNWSRALILATGATKIGIVGPGTIDGRNVHDPNGEEHIRGPHAIALYDCTDVSVRNVAIRDSGNYGIIVRSGEAVSIDGVSVEGGWDGINMHDVRHATIAHCRFFTGDDCLAGAYWQDVEVHDCFLNASANAIRVGGKDVVFHDLEIEGPAKYPAGTSLRRRLECGFQILPQRANAKNKHTDLGPIDNITVERVRMRNVGTPIWIDCGAGAPYSNNNLGIGRITLRDIQVQQAGKTPMYVCAQAEKPLQSLVLAHFDIDCVGGADEADAEGQGFSPFSLLQAYGGYFRHVDRLTLDHVTLRYEAPDNRPPLFLEDVGSFETNQLAAKRASSAVPLCEATHVRHWRIDGQDITPTPLIAEAISVPAAVRQDECFPFSVAVRRERGDCVLGDLAVETPAAALQRTIWITPPARTNVTFINVRAILGREPAIKAGLLEQFLNLVPKPVAHEILRPFAVFQNVNAEIADFDGAWYLRAEGSAAILQRGDQYGAIFLRKKLNERDSVEVQLDNPDLQTSWFGRAGLMARREIDQPDRSTGYVILSSSPANGSYLEWDANGDGRLDEHTEFDGYTFWPHWLKLVRRGRVFTGYVSRDGRDWRKVGESLVPGADGPLDVGVFVFRSSAMFRGFELRSESR